MQYSRPLFFSQNPVLCRKKPFKPGPYKLDYVYLILMFQLSHNQLQSYHYRSSLTQTLSSRAETPGFVFLREQGRPRGRTTSTNSLHRLSRTFFTFWKRRENARVTPTTVNWSGGSPRLSTTSLSSTPRPTRCPTPSGTPSPWPTARTTTQVWSLTHFFHLLAFPQFLP